MTGPRFRFGLFEFDSASGELRREGDHVRLEAQPAQVLRLLLTRAGQTVTREELRQAVWGSDTFVDFDRGLNYCIAQIRASLKDSAQSPRFVRTFPKRGYEFIAPVEQVETSPPGCAVLEPRADTPRQPSRLYWIAGAIAVLLAIAFYAWTSRAASTVPFRIAVVHFDNEAGNPQLDPFSDGLTDSLVADLTTAGVGRYGVIGNADILRTPRDRRNLLAIGSALQAQYVVLGQVQQNGSDVRVLCHLIHLPDQTHLWVTRTDLHMDDPLRSESEISKRTATEFSAHLASHLPQRAALQQSASH
jgi:DNA-binding winged helix-turn-helix (wHTH) protein/TolB-like protein